MKRTFPTLEDAIKDPSVYDLALARYHYDHARRKHVGPRERINDSQIIAALNVLGWKVKRL
jgi:hypothetical protein